MSHHDTVDIYLSNLVIEKHQRQEHVCIFFVSRRNVLMTTSLKFLQRGGVILGRSSLEGVAEQLLQLSKQLPRLWVEKIKSVIITIFDHQFMLCLSGCMFFVHHSFHFRSSYGLFSWKPSKVSCFQSKNQTNKDWLVLHERIKLSICSFWAWDHFLEESLDLVLLVSRIISRSGLDFPIRATNQILKR